MEPVSPELVLVDPELARRERQRLEERAWLDERRAEPIAGATVELAPVFDIGAMRRAVEIATAQHYDDEDDVAKERPVERFRRLVYRRSVALVAFMLLGMSSLALGATVARRGGSAHEADPPTVPSGAQTAAVPAEPKTQTKPAKAPQQAPSNGEVERRVLTEVLSLSSRPLPASLVDQRTRLLRTNVRAVCRPHGSLRFDCSVEPPQGSRGKKLPVIVQVHAGKWHFAWGFARRR